MRFLPRKGSPSSGPNIGIIKPQAPQRLEQSSCTNKLFRNSCTPWRLNKVTIHKKKTNCFRKLFSPVNMFTFQPLPICNRKGWFDRGLRNPQALQCCPGTNKKLDNNESCYWNRKLTHGQIHNIQLYIIGYQLSSYLSPYWYAMYMFSISFQL